MFLINSAVCLFSLIGYVFLPYINGPCALQASYNTGIYKTNPVNVYNNIVNVPYSFKIDGKDVNGLYQHAINHTDVEYINKRHIDNNITSSCKTVQSCIDSISAAIYEKLFYILKHEKNRQKCFSFHGLFNNIIWSTRSSFSNWFQVRINPNSEGKIIVIENISNPADSIKMFMYVHHYQSWKNGYDSDMFKSLEQSIIKQFHFHNICNTERILAYFVVFGSFVFVFLKRLLFYLFASIVNTGAGSANHQIQSNFDYEKRKNAIPLKSAMQSMQYNIITVLKFVASLLLLFSHSYAFTGNFASEPINKNFRFKHSIANMMLCVQLTLSGFLCQESSCRKIMTNSDFNRGNCCNVVGISLKIFINRCGNLIKQHIMSVLVCLFVVCFIACLTSSDEQCIGRDINFQRDLFSYLYANIFEHPVWAIFPKTLLMPAQTLGSIFSENAINDSLWTIPHQIFCYVMIFFVDTLSCYQKSSLRFESLFILYTSFYVLRAIQFVDNGELDYNIIPKGNMEWYGHHGRYAIYSDFLCGALLHHAFRFNDMHYAFKLSKLAVLNLSLSFAPLLAIPWFLHHGSLFAVFYSPLVSLFTIMVSQSVFIDSKNNVFAMIDEPILKSSNIMYFFGTPIQKSLYHFFSIQNIFLVFILTACICVALHNVWGRTVICISLITRSCSNSIKTKIS